MTWSEIRTQYPDQWVVVHVLDAHTSDTGKRVIGDLAVAKMCPSGLDALQAYRNLHAEHPDREYLYLHTRRETLDVTEERWLGIRIPLAAHA